jgi:sulfate adenylyltransferase
VDTDSLLDIENIAVGTFSPLKGFMTKEELLSVAHNMTLPNGIVWTIPILLQLREEPKIGGRIAIKDGKGQVKAVLDVKEVYKIDLKKIARLVWGTESDEHPGVRLFYSKG